MILRIKDFTDVYKRQGSGYNPDWEKEGVVATVQNRDSRLGIFTKKPGDVNYRCV